LKIAEVFLRERQEQMKIRSLPDCLEALVLDFDGVFTDNRVLVHQNGQESVICHRGDGWGLTQLKALGLPLLVISTEENPVVQARCDKLNISCLQGIQDKLAALLAWAAEQKLMLEHIVYLGNDVNDLSCLQAVGCGVAVHDACSEVCSNARIVLGSNGGQGAIRELADLIIQKRKGV